MSVEFVLSAFESAFTLAESAEIPDYTPSITTDAVLTLNVSVAKEVLHETFFYHTDTLIADEGERDVHYYVDKSKFPLLETIINPKNGVVNMNAHSALNTDPLGKDFLRELALQLFGTTLGVDLFTNEEVVVLDINAKADGVAADINDLIASIDQVSGMSMLTDADGKKYLDDSNAEPANISRELFNQLMTSAPTRFADIDTDWKYGEVANGFYKMPIMAGDKITYKLTVSPAAGQRLAVPTSTATLVSRSYTVTLNVV